MSIKNDDSMITTTWTNTKCHQKQVREGVGETREGVGDTKAMITCEMKKCNCKTFMARKVTK